ncbi:MAG: hypothetical protein ABI960_09165, partial [Candidatus Eisenbacteria bacterium]
MSERKDPRVALLQAAGPLVAVALALVVGAGFIAAVGKDPFAVYAHMASGVFGNAYGIGQVLFRATPLIFTGLAVALGFRAGLFNIGAEGQIYIGALFATAVGISLPDLPLLVHLPLAVAAGFVGGAVWGFVPGILKARTGAHEVITTIMLNYVSYLIVDLSLPSLGRVRGLREIRRISPDTRIIALAESPNSEEGLLALKAGARA